MKRVGLIRTIEGGGCVFVRHGGKHDWYRNPLTYLRKAYGRGRWRKLKGKATVRLLNGAVREVELHWYEVHGIGKRDLKIKYYLDEL
jgi:hypothetical protein